MSSPDLRRINKIEVPFVVVLGERPIKLRDILTWVPGSIVELSKEADEELEIRINNKTIGNGTAVKVGENFGVQVNYCGDPKQRIEAMGDNASASSSDEVDAEAMAAALLDGQL
ncbi:MAG: FliM/FliN family flagellar motor switch protein [Phycisphaerales bacterium]|jgi:flagellar motor switch protein FliN/FliY|nr:FliM/FliN family flagellar motor switch protein [Phycisphaerales bacterium]